MNETLKMRAPLSILLACAMLSASCSSEQSAGGGEAPPLAGAAIGGPFTLVNQDGETVRDSDFAGKYRLVYFGYSYCPDICPVDLQVIGRGLAAFDKSDPERAKRVQPIFISVDPERDTPKVLKPYVAAFHPRLIGLTGSPDQIAATAKSYGVYYAKAPQEESTEYLMDHSRQAMLFGPQGEPIALVPQDQGPQAITAELERWVK